MANKKNHKKSKKGMKAKTVLKVISASCFAVACVSVGIVLSSTYIGSFITTPFIGPLVGFSCTAIGCATGYLSDYLSYKVDKYEKLAKQMKNSKGRSSILSQKNMKSNENDLNKNNSTEKGKSFVEKENEKRMSKQQLEVQLSQ